MDIEDGIFSNIATKLSHTLLQCRQPITMTGDDYLHEYEAIGCIGKADIAIKSIESLKGNSVTQDGNWTSNSLSINIFLVV